MIGNDLYKRGHSTSLVKCLSQEQVEYILQELHEGICVLHCSAQTMATKVLCAEYYWPPVRKDCNIFVRSYKKCQEFNNLNHMLSQESQGINSLCPFTKWGMDIRGPFPPGRG